MLHGKDSISLVFSLLLLLEFRSCFHLIRTKNPFHHTLRLLLVPCFCQIPGMLSYSFHSGIASFWPLYHEGLTDGDGCPHSRFFHLCRGVLNFTVLDLMDGECLYFSTKWFYTLAQLCASTQVDCRSLKRTSLAWFLIWHTLWIMELYPAVFVCLFKPCLSNRICHRWTQVT